VTDNIKPVIDRKGAIVDVLAERQGQGLQTDLDNWIEGNHLIPTTVGDPDAVMDQSLKALERREICYIVDLGTMKIVNKIMGSVLGLGDSSAKQGLSDMLNRWLK